MDGIVMGLTPNSVTEVVPGAWTAAGIVLALDTFFASGGGASTFVRQFTGVDAFVIRSSVDTIPQYSFRAISATQIALEIEPSGSLSNAGDGSTRPSGASADNSGSGRYLTLGTLGAGSKIWVIEHDDCVTILMKSTTGTSWQPSIQIGRITVPSFPDVDEHLGRDGLGFFVGAPAFSSGSVAPDPWIEGTTPVTGSVMHVATNIWDEPSYFGTVTTGEATADSAATMGYVRPYQIPAMPQALSYSPIGNFKYVLKTGNTRAPLTRIDVNNLTDLAFITGGLGGSTSAVTIVIPWLRGVVP
jgi:hypothetical protein